MKSELSAGGIVYRQTSQGLEWLITKHSQYQKWAFPKGLVGDVDKNELMETAALREVAEEGGVQAKIIRKITTPSRYVYTFNNQKITKTVWYFLMKYVSGDPANHDQEVSKAKFAPANEVLKTLNYENDRRIFQELLASLGQVR